jgi:hypothetical protein
MSEKLPSKELDTNTRFHLNQAHAHIHSAMETLRGTDVPQYLILSGVIASIDALFAEVEVYDDP